VAKDKPYFERSTHKGVGRKISGEGGATEKDRKIAKKTENNTIKLLPREPTEKRPK